MSDKILDLNALIHFDESMRPREFKSDYLNRLVRERAETFYKNLKTQEDNLTTDKKKILDIYKGVGIKPVAKPNTDVITSDVKTSAILADAAFKVYRDSPEQARMYLRENGLDWKLREYNHSGAIFTKGNETRVAYRGTDFKGLNKTDLTIDATMITGVEDVHPEYKTATDLYKLAVRKYGKVDKLVGYSKGGNLAMNIGYDNNVPVEVFNPAIGYKLITKSINKTNPVEVHTTTEDFASVLNPLLSGKVKVNRSLPNNININPLEAHRIDNFIKDTGRKRTTNLSLEEQNIFMSRLRGEFMMSRDMVDSISKGETLTEFFREHEPGDFNNETGEIKYDRIFYKDEPRFKMWEEFGGQLTESESTVINRLPKLPETEGSVVHHFATTTEDRLDFIDLPERAQINHLNNLEEFHTNLIMNGEETHKVNTRFMENVSREIHPTTIGRAALTTTVGAGVGIGALVGVEEINRQFHLKLTQEQTMAEQAGTLGATSALLTGATKIGRLAAGVGGAAGFVTGALAQEGTEEFLEEIGLEEPAAEAISVLTGGAVGGLTTGVAELGVTRAAAFAGVETAITAVEGASLASAGATLGMSLLGGLILSGIIYGGSKLVESIIDNNSFNEFKEKYKDTSLANNEQVLRAMYDKKQNVVSPERQAVIDQMNNPATSENTRIVLKNILAGTAHQITPDQQLEYYKEHDPDKYESIMLEADRLAFEEEQRKEKEIQTIIKEAGYETRLEFDIAVHEEKVRIAEEQERMEREAGERRVQQSRQEAAEYATYVSQLEQMPVGTLIPKEVIAPTAPIMAS